MSTSTKHILFSLARSLAIVAVLVTGSAFLECATTQKPTPIPSPTPAPDGGAPSPSRGCDGAHANLVKLGCKFSDAFPSTCAAINDQKFVDCVTNATSCDFADTCNQPF
jgi:hypothetical protein